MPRTAYQFSLWKDGPSMVFFEEKSKNVPLCVEIRQDTVLCIDPYTGNTLEECDAKTFARQVGYIVEDAPKRPRIPQYGVILNALREKGVQVPEREPKVQKGKGKEPKVQKGKVQKGKGKEPKARFSREHCEEYDRLVNLQKEYPYSGNVRPQPDGRGLVFSMPDNKGHPALAVYDGGGKFRGATTRDIRDLPTGTRTIARNNWAARILTEKWSEQVPT